MLDKGRSYWLPVAIAIAFLAVAVLGIVTYQTTISIRLGERRVIKSYAIREVTHRLLSAVKDMETGERGYLITGNATYLEPYHAGEADVRKEFSRLRELLADNPVRLTQVDHLETLVDQKQRELSQTIALRSTKPAAPISGEILETVNSDRGRIAMDQARAAVDKILADEGRQLGLHEENSETLASISRAAIAAGNLIALASILAVALIALLDRKRRDVAESTLQVKQSELSAIIDSAHDGIVTFHDDLRVRLMNPAATAMFATDAQLASGRLVLDFISPSLRDSMGAMLSKFLESLEQSRPFLNARGLRSDGTEFPIDGVVTKSQVKGEHMNTLMFRDLTEELAGQVKEQHLSAVMKQVRDAIIVCDLDGKILSWNDGATLMYGQTETQVLGRHAADILFPEQRECWDAGYAHMLRTGVHTQEIKQLDKQNREFIVEHRQSLIHDATGTASAQLILNIDVTERKQDEAVERRSQRLESIGTLAGGIAHDLNNVLTPILMSAKLVKRGSQNQARLLDTIVLSAERGGRMLKKLLAFAGGDKSDRQLVNLRDVVLEAQEILSHTLPKTIELHVDTPENLLPIMGDATELSQVLMNLAINARDAMPRGGQLTIKTANVDVLTSHVKSDNLRSGPHILLTVADTGEGIHAEIIDRIFDPFFTTKTQGRGTGLGLATSLGIVRSYGGDINVSSEPGGGTTFFIYLPSGQMDMKTHTIYSSDTDFTKGQGETILVVDDEAFIVETARETLEFAGYRVLSAVGGADALSTYQQRAAEIDLVLLDMMMPGIDGFAVKTGLRSISPNIRIIASSGLRRPGYVGAKMQDFDGFLAKPYSAELLLETVRTVLDFTN